MKHWSMQQTWMNPENIKLREQKNQIIYFHIYEIPNKGQFIETESKLVID